MKKICIVTTTRAEYGLFRPLIRGILEEQYFELCLVVSGTHLVEEFGHTIWEIEKDGFPIAEKIPILDIENSEIGVCNTMGNANRLFGEMFARQKPDMLVVLGDRYELIPICSSAMIFRIPIAHISGGEITEGIMDDVFRHCITKMSYLHFPGCEEYRRRIIQLGEEPKRVFNFGDIGIENIKKMHYLTKKELEDAIGYSLEKPYAEVTFHPVTLENNTAEIQTMELVEALSRRTEINFIITLANADMQGNVINRVFKEAAGKYQNIFCYPSLGIQRYLSLVRYAEFVIGNSSSGIIEVPCFGVPTINIGERQKGRLRADSVIDCDAKKEDILKSIEKAMSQEFREIARNASNPYGEGNTSEKIIETIKDFFESDKIDLKKKFYDL